MRTVLRSTLVVLIATLAASSIDAGGLRIALLSSVEVQNDTVLLGNLLPPDAPAHIRNLAASLSLGAAPQLGLTREISAAALSSSIFRGGLSPAQFAIPATVSVRRDTRLLSNAEILAAVQSALASRQLPLLSPSSSQLIQEAQVRVPPGDAGLQVTQLSLDPLLGSLRFRMAAKSAPNLVPFYVTAKLDDPGSASSGSTSSHKFHLPTPGSSAKQPTTPALIVAGQLAQLHLHSADMDMVLSVRSLQRGSLNDVIQVRLHGSGRILQARVIAKGYLDANL